MNIHHLPPSDPPTLSTSSHVTPKYCSYSIPLYDDDFMRLFSSLTPSPPKNTAQTLLAAIMHPSATSEKDNSNHGSINIDLMSDISIVQRARLAVADWTSPLGPVDDWPKVFHNQYDEACCDMSCWSTQDSIDMFLRNVMEHVWVGRSILRTVEMCATIKFPFSGHEADRLLAGDSMHTLHWGIAILEAWLELYAPSGPHITELQSNIHCHSEPLDL